MVGGASRQSDWWVSRPSADMAVVGETGEMDCGETRDSGATARYTLARI